MTERAVFLTGASGLVGAEVVSQLRAADRRVIVLTHRKQTIVDSAGREFQATDFAADPAAAVTYVRGDVREPGFGLSTELRAALAERVEVLVHSAATTDFAAAEELYQELNVGGARNAAALALEWGVPLVYVSTAYVCGRRDGVITEDQHSEDSGFGNPYEQSKFTAERYIRDCPGLDWAIVRPGIVTGRTGTGAIRDKKNLYTVVRLITEGKLRTLPGRYDADLALAPVDFVAAVVTAVVADTGRAHGRTFHAVGAGGVSLRVMSDVFAEYPSFEVARFVPPSSFRVDDLDDLEREYYERIGVQYVSYFDRKRVFLTDEVTATLRLAVPVTDTDYLRTLLDRCLEDGFLGAALPTVSEVVECSN